MLRQIAAISALAITAAPMIALNSNIAMAQSAQTSNSSLQTAVNGRNVKVVSHSGGVFADQGNGTWIEVNADNKNGIRFKETNRDEWSVYLFDSSRNVQIQLDLYRKKVVYSNSQQRFDLYTITDAKSEPTQSPVASRPANLAPGRLDKNTGTVDIQPLNEDKLFNLPSLGQTGNISLTVKPKLIMGADGAKYLHVDLDGSTVSASQANLGKDDKYQRGWFLENVTTTITPLDQNVRFYKAADLSGGGESGTVSSTLSQTISGSGSKGNGEFGISQSVGNTYTRNLLGFSALTPSRLGQGVSNDYKLSGILFEGDQGLKPYTNWNSVVDKEIDDSFWGGFASVFTTKAWYGFKVHGLPERAKKGLPLVSQAIFTSGSNFSRPVTVRVEVKANLRRVWVTGDTKFDAKAHTESFPVSLTKDVVVDFGFNYPS